VDDYLVVTKQIRRIDIIDEFQAIKHRVAAFHMPVLQRFPSGGNSQNGITAEPLTLTTTPH
jgi:hypothetical protein